MKIMAPGRRPERGGWPGAIRGGAAAAARGGLVLAWKRPAAKVFMVAALVGVSVAAEGQITIPVIGQIVAKVVQAIDLKVQRLQTATIGLQEVQKEAENVMSALRLDEIREWVQEQRDLYASYFQELWKVKTVLTDYHKVSEILRQQAAMLASYQQSMALFRQDSHFSAAELAEMETVYARILKESVRNLDRVNAVINSFTTQMTDEERMAVIDGVAADMNRDEQDLKDFTIGEERVSVERAGDENEIEFLKKIYGL